MINRPSSILLAAIALVLVSALGLAGRTTIRELFTETVPEGGDVFTPQPFPLTEIRQIFDIGVTDANGDGHLDIYTSNHNYRQYLLLGDGAGGYHNVLEDWRLNQNSQFPGLEQSYEEPVIDKPGLYIYWHGSHVFLRVRGLGAIGDWRGTLQVHAGVRVSRNQGFQARVESDSASQSSAIESTVIDFTASDHADLDLLFNTWGLPIEFRIDGALQPEQIYVGRLKSNPGTVRFTLALRDRHAMAWADYDGDGRLDVYISRGALGGNILSFPQGIIDVIKDELLIQRADGVFEDVAAGRGIRKGNCSGRHAHWLDFDGDGSLDLFVNCYDRGRVEGSYPKQAYRQVGEQRFENVAETTALGMPEHQFGSLAWFDADGDGAVDMLAVSDEKLLQFRNRGGRFSIVSSYPRKSSARYARATIAETDGDAWRFDGKLNAADFDSDGDMDVFLASKKGNVLLKNESGKYGVVEPVSVGLPVRSLTAQWVDYDNDGFPDLHAVPQGLFRNDGKGSFVRTGLLALPQNKYQAAVINWFDIDNDGAIDVLFALSENPSYRGQLDFLRKKPVPDAWKMHLLQNAGNGNNWLQMELVGPLGNRQGIGTQVTLETSSGRQTHEVGSTEGSFFSQGHYRLYFGAGKERSIPKITVRWPDGVHQEFHHVRANQRLIVKKDQSGSSSRSGN